jgi:asparagine synthetase B (glutamine-hydrolysing)
VFGGYDHMHGWRSRLLGDLAFGTLGRTVGGALGRISDPRARRIGLLLQGGASGLPAQRSWRRVFSDREIRTLLPGIPVPLDHIGRADPLELEQSTYLQDTLLRDTDVMGMAHGVEIRAPYLDPGVLEVAARIGTPTLLRRDKPPKWVLREGWARELESASLARKKTGFTLDVAGWLRGEGRQPLNDAKSVLERSAMVDRAGLDRSWPSWFAKLDSTHPAAWTPLFAMVQLATQLARWGDP